MPSTLTCPHCQATLKTAAPVAPGRKVKCPKCAATFTVAQDEDVGAAITEVLNVSRPKPRPRDDEDEDDAPRSRRDRSRSDSRNGRDEDDDDRPSRRRRDRDYEEDDAPLIRRSRNSKKGGKGLLITMVVLGALVLVGGAIALVFILSGGGDSPDLANPNAQKLLGKWTNPAVGATIDFHRNGTLTATVFGRTNSGKWKFTGPDILELEEPNPLRAMGGKMPPGIAKIPGLDPNAATIKVQARVTFIGNDELRTTPLNFGVPQTLRRVK